MFNTINETKTPSELVEWLRLWANGYEDGDALDDNDARQIADAVVRVCAPCNAAVTREALMKAKLYFDRRGEGTNLDDAGMAIDAITSIDAALAAPPEPPSNAAAMREALEQAHNNIKRAREFIAWQTREDELLMEAQQEIKTALAAPARNCDRFATAEEARKAFEEEHSREIIHNLYTAAFDWLFAPAEGKEARRG